MFYGISIYMYPEAASPHHLPHFHAYFGEYGASFGIEPPILLEGVMPRRQLRLILAWAELHQEELDDNWHRLQSGRAPIRIIGL